MNIIHSNEMNEMQDAINAAAGASAVGAAPWSRRFVLFKNCGQSAEPLICCAQRLDLLDAYFLGHLLLKICVICQAQFIVYGICDNNEIVGYFVWCSPGKFAQSLLLNCPQH